MGVTQLILNSDFLDEVDGWSIHEGYIYILCRCKIGKIVMYYTLKPNFTPKCPAYYTLINSEKGKQVLVYVTMKAFIAQN